MPQWQHAAGSNPIRNWTCTLRQSQPLVSAMPSTCLSCAPVSGAAGRAAAGGGVTGRRGSGAPVGFVAVAARAPVVVVGAGVVAVVGGAVPAEEAGVAGTCGAVGAGRSGAGAAGDGSAAT